MWRLTGVSGARLGREDTGPTEQMPLWAAEGKARGFIHRRGLSQLSTPQTLSPPWPNSPSLLKTSQAFLFSAIKRGLNNTHTFCPFSVTGIKIVLFSCPKEPGRELVSFPSAVTLRSYETRHYMGTPSNDQETFIQVRKRERKQFPKSRILFFMEWWDDFRFV